MTFERATSFLVSPIFLRALGVVLVVVGLFGIAKGLFGDLGEGELWWGYVGLGFVSLGFSAGPFIFASAEAEMRADDDGDNNEERSLSRSQENISGQRTLH